MKTNEDENNINNNLNINEESKKNNKTINTNNNEENKKDERAQRSFGDPCLVYQFREKIPQRFRHQGGLC